jgi:tRNA pseudouridine55 synthase
MTESTTPVFSALPAEGEVWLVDKPLGWTSFDAVAKIRIAYTKTDGIKRKVGHAGTLDPKATGLLLIAAGKKTKSISTLETLTKEYTGTIRLGAKTKSFDTETEEYDVQSVAHLTETGIANVVKSFLGKQSQAPPMFSAVKHQGKRLYELARKGKDVERAPKPIEIFEFEITRIGLPDIEFRILVSKGTYIRTVASEFGERLQVGGYLKTLRRTKVGDYSVLEAFSVEDVVKTIQSRKGL